MKPELQLKACADFDGYESVPRTAMFWHRSIGKHFKLDELPNYFTYDAIIPLIQKQPVPIRMFIFNYFGSERMVLMEFTPQQLVEALLRAHGKWTE